MYFPFESRVKLNKIIEYFYIQLLTITYMLNIYPNQSNILKTCLALSSFHKDLKFAVFRMIASYCKTYFKTYLVW